MDEDKIDWAIMYISLRFDRKGRQYMYGYGGKTWKKNSEGRAELISDKSLNKLISSGAETITTLEGETYDKQMDKARFINKTPERFIRYLRTNPPSLGYETISS